MSRLIRCNAIGRIALSSMPVLRTAGSFAIAWIVLLPVNAGSQESNAVRRFAAENKVGRNQLVFSVDTGTEKVTGVSDDPRWTLQLDPANVAKTLRSTLVVPVDSIDAGKPEHNEKLRGPNWLNSAKHPSIQFELQSVKSAKAIGSNQWQVECAGEISARGATHQATAVFRVVYVPESDATRKRATGDLVSLSGQFELPLRVFSADELVDKKLTLELRLFGTTKASTNQPGEPK